MAKQAQGARLEGSRWTPYIFIAPVAVYLLVFQGYPLLQELILSFTSTSLLSPGDHEFVGLRRKEQELCICDTVASMSEKPDHVVDHLPSLWRSRVDEDHRGFPLERLPEINAIGVAAGERVL